MGAGVAADELAFGDVDVELRAEVGAALGFGFAAAVGEEDVGSGGCDMDGYLSMCSWDGWRK